MVKEKVLKHTVIDKKTYVKLYLSKSKLIKKKFKKYALICPEEMMEKLLFEPFKNRTAIESLIKNLNDTPTEEEECMMICLESLKNIDEMINNQIPNTVEQHILIRLGTAIKNNCTVIAYNK